MRACKWHGPGLVQVLQVVRPHTLRMAHTWRSVHRSIQSNARISRPAAQLKCGCVCVRDLHFRLRAARAAMYMRRDDVNLYRSHFHARVCAPRASVCGASVCAHTAAPVVTATRTSCQLGPLPRSRASSQLASSLVTPCACARGTSAISAHNHDRGRPTPQRTMVHAALPSRLATSPRRNRKPRANLFPLQDGCDGVARSKLLVSDCVLSAHTNALARTRTDSHARTHARTCYSTGTGMVVRTRSTHTHYWYHRCEMRANYPPNSPTGDIDSLERTITSPLLTPRLA